MTGQLKRKRNDSSNDSFNCHLLLSGGESEHLRKQKENCPLGRKNEEGGKKKGGKVKM